VKWGLVRPLFLRLRLATQARVYDTKGIGDSSLRQECRFGFLNPTGTRISLVNTQQVLPLAKSPLNLRLCAIWKLEMTSRSMALLPSLRAGYKSDNA
jgi:hypothetical protein